MNSQTKEIHRARSGRVLNGGTSVPVELGYVILPVWMCFYQHWSSLNPLLLRFYGGFHKFFGHDPSLTPLPAPLPSLDNMEGAENLKIFIMARSFWRSLPCRNHARTHPESPQENKRCSSLL